MISVWHRVGPARSVGLTCLPSGRGYKEAVGSAVCVCATLSLSLSRGAMAASSGDDIPAQLAALLGRTITRLRITDEVPPRISVVDLATAIIEKDTSLAAQDVAYVKERHPEVNRILSDCTFKEVEQTNHCLLYTSPSPRDGLLSRMPSSA